LTTFNRLVGFKARFVSALRGSAPPPEPTYDLIGRAITLFSMDEAEVDVFRAGYSCERDKDGGWRVAAPSENIARAFELGHLDSMWQDLLRVRASTVRGPDIVHLGDVAKEFAKTLGETLFRIVPGPPRRVRLEIPAQVANHIGLALIVKDELYAEEFEWIGATCYELVARPRELESVRIGTHITLWDVLLISRVFRLLMVGWLDAMDRLGDDLTARLNSSIQVGPGRRSGSPFGSKSPPVRRGRRRTHPKASAT
jgi:hypothetical protein